MAIKRKLTFVIGAGASYELGLPVGRGLLDDLSKMVTNVAPPYDPYTGNGGGKSIKVHDDEFKNVLQTLSCEKIGSNTYTKIGEYVTEALWISQNCALAPSIDNLLHSHQNNPKLVNIGKHMICAALKAAETKSCLMPAQKNNFHFGYLFKKATCGRREVSAASSWLGQLFWLLAEGTTFDDFLSALGEISFISFNYDRCIQHFLINATTSYFRLNSIEQVQRVADAIQIVFPYGHLGQLTISETGASGFGDFNIAAAAINIRTFTEGMTDSASQDVINKMINSCDELVFLGFGFHDINLQILFSDLSTTNMHCVSGTAFGFSDRNKVAVANKISNLVRPKHKREQFWTSGRIILENLSCYDFFSANSIGLRS